MAPSIETDTMRLRFASISAASTPSITTIPSNESHEYVLIESDAMQSLASMPELLNQIVRHLQRISNENCGT